MKSMIKIAVLAVVLPLFTYAQDSEPILIPPVKKVLKTSGISCGLDKEALKCWGPKHIDPVNASSVVDFEIKPSGDMLYVLRKKSDALGRTTDLEMHKVSIYGHGSVYAPRMPMSIAPVNSPKRIYLKYPDLDSICIQGEGEDGVGFDLCSLSTGDYITYSDEASHEVAFNPCHINLSLGRKITSCANLPNPRVSYDSSLESELESLGIRNVRSSPFRLNLGAHLWTECDRDGRVTSKFREGGLEASIPANKRHFPDGVKRISEEEPIREFGYSDFKIWGSKQLQALFLPELQCTRYPDIKYVSLNEKGPYRLSGDELFEEDKKLLLYELGMKHVKVSFMEISFSNKKGDANLSFSFKNHASERFGPADIVNIFLENLKVYDQFFVFYNKDKFQVYDYRIFNRDWIEIANIANGSGSKARRKFKLNGTTYSCVAENCYKVVRSK